MTEEINDPTATMMTADKEALFREIVRGYCEVVTQNPKLEPFARGVMWGAQQILRADGYGDWAESVMAQEMESYSNELQSQGLFGKMQAGGLNARMRRILIPGNRFESGLGR